jgi:oligoendopeptidase F
LTEAWQKNSSLAAMMLNSQAGFRLALYKNRGWKSALFEPLFMSRLQEKSLMAMWDAVLSAAPRFKKYIDTKKRLLGIDKFNWYDQNAPVGKSSKSFTFDAASDFIIEQISGFSKDMAEFTKMALAKNWVEAENRPGKAAGAFCTGLGEVKESRVFMTFENNYDSLLTLAHELGHAYHHHVLKDDPAFAQFYPMGLAETASTFNELLVTDAALSRTEDPQEKIMLLDQILSNGFIMFCNIHARFIFDRQFYIERTHGLVGKDRLNELMLKSQKTAYCDMLDDDGYHPEFWASKLHFYETQIPFYNFPYTFGFLFSNAVYRKAKEEGPAFAEKYRQLLSDTGVMSSEDVAKKYLDADLTDAGFWKWVTDKVTEDIDTFVKLADES